jgi:hypothetical protein
MRAMRFDHGGSGRMGADRHVVECKADERLVISHQSRRERQVPREAMRCASSEMRC